MKLEVINVGNEMRKDSKLKVSKDAITEYINRIKLGIELNMVELEKIAKENNRKTIQEEDVINLCGRITFRSVIMSGVR